MKKMFNYPKKQLIIGGSIFVVLLITTFLLVSTYRSRAIDLQIISQTQILAAGLEKYYAQFNTYPAVEEVSLDKIKFLTDQGFNQSGEKNYYQREEKWTRAGTLVSSGSSYVIKFSLKNSWPVWQLNKFGGGDCRLTNNIVLTCSSE